MLNVTLLNGKTIDRLLWCEFIHIAGRRSDLDATTNQKRPSLTYDIDTDTWPRQLHVAVLVI